MCQSLVITWNFNPRSLAGATVAPAPGTATPLHFNPRSLEGATRQALSWTCRSIISILAPSRERPSRARLMPMTDFKFQSTLPYGSDPLFRACDAYFRISIHAPLRERRCLSLTSDLRTDISIHAPLRERPLCGISLLALAIFQSTLPYGSDED